jgi:hypothetical protein
MAEIIEAVDSAAAVVLTPGSITPPITYEHRRSHYHHYQLLIISPLYKEDSGW